MNRKTATTENTERKMKSLKFSEININSVYPVVAREVYGTKG